MTLDNFHLPLLERQPLLQLRAHELAPRGFADMHTTFLTAGLHVLGEVHGGPEQVVPARSRRGAIVTSVKFEGKNQRLARNAGAYLGSVMPTTPATTGPV